MVEEYHATPYDYSAPVPHANRKRDIHHLDKIVQAMANQSAPVYEAVPGQTIWHKFICDEWPEWYRVPLRIRCGRNVIPPVFPVSAEVVAISHLTWSDVEGFNFYIKRRFWTIDQQVLATKVANTTGVKLPEGLSHLGTRGKISLKDFSQRYSLVGGLPGSFSAKALKAYGVHPKLVKSRLYVDPFLEAIAMKEGVLQMLANNSLANGYKFQVRRRLAIARFIESTWDAVRQALLAAHMWPSEAWIKKWTWSLVMDPPIAYKFKEFSNEARAFAFGKITEVQSPIWEGLAFPNTEGLLQLSFLGRSLPAPLVFVDPLQDFYDRQERPLMWPQSRTDSFVVWAHLWATRFKPKKLTLKSVFTTSGCAEFTRAEGGIPSALRLYSIFQRCRELNGAERFTRFDNALAACAPYTWIPSEKWRLAVGGCTHVMETWSGPIPAIPIAAPEKGLKVRIPTKTVLPVLVLGGFLRHIIDQFLVNDPRIGPSITPGDHLRHHFPAKPGKWQSIDCVQATDNFTPEYVGILYNAVLTVADSFLLPETLSWLRHIASWLFTNRKGIEAKKFLPPPKIPRQLPPAIARNMPPKHTERIPRTSLNPWDKCEECDFYKTAHNSHCPDHRLPNSLEFEYQTWIDEMELDPSLSAFATSYTKRFGDIPLNKIQLENHDLNVEERGEFINRMTTWLNRVSTQNGVLFKRGAMMGDPTSWPGLPILTLFCWEHVVEYEYWLYIATTGDDAYFQATVEQNILFCQLMAELGTKFSESKYFSHRHLALYCEKVLRDGKMEPYQSLAPLVGPQGGSKGESNWSTAPSAALALAKQRKIPYLPSQWRASRFYPEWMAAKRLGIPIWLPPRWGGLNVPIKSKWSDRKSHALWGSTVAQLSRIQMALDGPRLNYAENPKLSGVDVRTLVRNAQASGTRVLVCRAEKFGTADIAADPSPYPKENLGGRHTSNMELCREAIQPSGITFTMDDSFLERRILSPALTDTGIPLTELREKLSRPAEIDSLLSGKRPVGGSIPTLTRVAKRFHRRIRSRGWDKGVPADDQLLIETKESLLLVRADLESNKPGVIWCGLRGGASLPIIRVDNPENPG